jgi:hypothetical protein
MNSGCQSWTLLKSNAAALQPGAACFTRSLAQFCSSLKYELARLAMMLLT